MTPERWQRAQEIFAEAIAREAGAVVATACGSDAELSKEVESLLAAHAAATSNFLASPAMTPTQMSTWPVESAAPLENGVRLGPYEIVVPIGAGGMGQVYRARDSQLDRDVAIKGGARRDGVLVHAGVAENRSQLRFSAQQSTLPEARGRILR